jgi:hypothetical protein
MISLIYFLTGGLATVLLLFLSYKKGQSDEQKTKTQQSNQILRRQGDIDAERDIGDGDVIKWLRGEK